MRKSTAAIYIVAVAIALVTTTAVGHVQLGADIDGEAANDNSGVAVSLNADGSIVAIGAMLNDGRAMNAGHVRVYQLSGTSWLQLGADIDGEAASDNSGFAVSLSADGTIVAIGARYNDGNGLSAGHVRVYQFDGTDWLQRGTDIDGEAAMDNSGIAVSLSSDGSAVAIGAEGNDGSFSVAGHVRVYAFDGFDWQQRGSDIDGEEAGDKSGSAVSLSADGSIVAIGASSNSGNGTGSGHVRVFQYDGSDWQQRGSDIDGEAAMDYSGVAVSLSADGNIVAIGAYANDGNGSGSGHVRIFYFDGADWLQRGADIDGESADYTGSEVSLSADGTVVAIGGEGSDVNGVDSGVVRVYQFNGSDWLQRGADIYGETTDDNSGSAVSLSADGNVVAIGAIGNDGETGYGSGHVRVYNVSTATESDTSESTPDISGGSVSGDPHFTGFLGQRFEFHGGNGQVYNLISAHNVQVNGRFVANSQWGDSRSFLGAVAVQDRDGRVSVSCMNDTLVTVANGQVVDSGLVVAGGMSINVNSKGASIDSPVCTASITLAKNRWSSCYINVDFGLTKRVDRRRVHGLIGQTARLVDDVAAETPMTKYEDGVFRIQGLDSDYRIDNGDLFGSSFRFNRFVGKV